MSYSGKKTGYEECSDQRRAYDREQEVRVTCKGLHFIHKTERGGVLVQEGEELAGSSWRVHGKKTWLPAQACHFTPPLQSLDKEDPVEVELPKRLADEKEMFYE